MPFVRNVTQMKCRVPDSSIEHPLDKTEGLNSTLIHNDSSTSSRRPSFVGSKISRGPLLGQVAQDNEWVPEHPSRR